jgi:Secretory lipase
VARGVLLLRSAPPVRRLAVVLLIVSGFAAGIGAQAVNSLREGGSPTRNTSADVDPTGPGSLVSALPMPGLTRAVGGARAARVVYRSTNGDTGAATVVSGVVFVPDGRPPAGGWPVLAMGHESTGIQEPCAPSLSPELLDRAPQVAGFIKRGYAVALADYQGLGTDGVHPFLDARTAGLNIIDAVRALRATFPAVSDQWAASGRGQGGGAVWAADEQAATYAPELHLVGAVVMSPTADMTELVDKSEQGTLNSDQTPMLQWVLASLSRLHPDVNLDEFRRGVAAQYWDALSACSGPLVHIRNQEILDLGANDLAPATPQAADQLRGLLQAWALPQRPLSAPLFVMYWRDDSSVDPQWTTGVINRACALGGTLVWRLEPAQSHADVDEVSQVDWLTDRFAGDPVANECASGAFSRPDSGAVVSTEALPDLTDTITSTGAQAARVVYRSTEGDTGAPTVVSGAVFAPAGTPPEGGWPVVAFAHGTTGIDEPCAPSLSTTLLNEAPIVAGLLALGYAVAVPDYQGLGADGVHPYLDARTAGLNVIDAVRALRATFPDIGNRWAAIGHSQGGGAAWAADEQAATYAPELQLVGAVALSPAADVTGLVDKSEQGTLTGDQGLALQVLLVSLGRLHPDLNLDDFRRGVAAQYWDALSACSGPLLATRTEVAGELGPQDLSPATTQAADQLRGLLKAWALPQRQLSAPMSVVYGTDDTYVDSQWTTDAIERSCALGSTLVSGVQPGKGHDDIDFGGQINWLADRFAGAAITDGCT